MEEPDPQLIAAARSGDLHSFETLVRRYQSSVYRFVVHLTSDPSLAEDITQETFVKAFRSLRRYRGESRFTTWLFTIARNCTVDDARAAARRARLSQNIQHDRVATTSDSSGAFELREAIADLPAELAEPLLLIDLFGFSYAEVAALSDAPEGTIKSRVHRARRRLIVALSSERAEKRHEL